VDGVSGIQDPFLHAACQLAMAWSLPIVGDLDGALREASVSLEELRGHDEPVFTAIAAFAVGSLEMTLGRYDDALHHLREARGFGTGGSPAALPHWRAPPGHPALGPVPPGPSGENSAAACRGRPAGPD
jgi:hypothetical protein